MVTKTKLEILFIIRKYKELVLSKCILGDGLTLDFIKDVEWKRQRKGEKTEVERRRGRGHFVLFCLDVSSLS